MEEGIGRSIYVKWLRGSGVLRPEDFVGLEMEEKMEQVNRVAFETESVFLIGGIRFIVTAHYDETQESLPEKLARLLKKEVCTLDEP